TGQVGLAQLLHGFFVGFCNLPAAFGPAEQFKVLVIREQQVKQFLRGPAEDAVHAVAGILVPGQSDIAAFARKDFFLRVTQQILLKQLQDIFKCQHQPSPPFLMILSLVVCKSATIRAKKKRGRPGDAACTRQTSLTAGAYAPVTSALPAMSIPDVPRPTKPPAAGIYPPNRRHKCARFRAHGGPAGSSYCWNSASGTPAPSAPAVPGAPHSRPGPS